MENQIKVFRRVWGIKVKKKKQRRRTIILLVIVLILAALCGVAYYLYERASSGLFFEETKINGYDVSGKSCKEVLLFLEKEYSVPQVEICEKGETALKLTLAEAGYTIDQMKLLSEIQDCMREQNIGLIFSLMEGNEFEVTIPFEYNEAVFQQAVSAQNFAVARTASTDAVMEYNGTEYYIEPETYGDELDDADLQVMVKDSLDKLVAAERPQADLKIDVPESFYFLPAVTQDDSEMNRLMQIYNTYCKAKITLTFGKTKEVIGWETIKEWLVITEDDSYIDDEYVYNYAYELAAKYDTYHYPHEFVTSDGATLTFDGSDYGYKISCDAEAEQILADIASNTAVEREPVYEVKGFSRNGRDDFNGNYVEVNLTKQHLWFYREGELVVETDLVSGLPKDGRETATGIFTIPYKIQDTVLKGETWEADVEYWMPFHDGQGLHDAPWRSSFGGNIYQSNGSHGCVNLPPAAAKTIFENMEERMPIILYK